MNNTLQNLMKMVCRELGMEKVAEVILADERWSDRLHRRYNGEGFHATFMEKTCAEIDIGPEYLQGKPPEEVKTYNHQGANIVLFVSTYPHRHELPNLTRITDAVFALGDRSHTAMER